MKVNLIAKFPDVRHQGERGTCVAFCLTAMNEYHKGSKSPNYSERHLYALAKASDDNPAACGTTQAAAAAVLESKGQCSEAIWKYNPNDACNDHGNAPAGAAADARKHTQKLTQLNPRDVVALKTALADKRPVGISVPVYNSWYQSPVTERTGRITLPIGGEPEVDGHCMCVVGYQDDTADTVTPTPGGGFFVLRNSWGKTWGAECPYGPGHGTIPYGYIAAFNWETYTLPEKRRTRSPRTRKRKRRSKK